MAKAEVKSSCPLRSLLGFVQNILVAIPTEQEKLRQAIQKLQAEMDHPDLC